MQGVIAAFRELDAAVHAVDELKKSRHGDVTVFMPTPRHELEDALHAPPSIVRRFTLVGGLLGASFGYWIAIWTSEYWPLVTGGKAVGSWIPYTIICFELMVLIGGLSTVFGMFYVSRIPRLTLTVGYDPRFSHGDFGVWVECPPDRIQPVEDIMRRNGAVEVRGER